MFFRNVQEHDLDRGAVSGQADTDDAHHNAGQPRDLPQTAQAEQQQGQAGKDPSNGLHAAVVSDRAADLIAADKADTQHEQDEVQQAVRQSHRLRDNRPDVGVKSVIRSHRTHDEEHARVDHLVFKKGKLGIELPARLRRIAGHQPDQQTEHDDADHADSPKAVVPRKSRADHGADRQADDRSQAEAGKHPRQQRRSLRQRGDEVGQDQDQRDDRTGHRRRHDPRQQQRRVARRQCRPGVGR